MAYKTDGRRWGSWRCDLDVTLPMWPASWQKSATNAMQAWNAAGASFTFAATPGSSDHLAAYDLGRWNGWLAMTQTQPRAASSLLSSANVLVNLHYEWSPAHPTTAHTDAGGAYDLESILLHELGHLLHLNDELTARDVMQPTIAPGVIRNQLGVDDTAGISYLYPMLAQFPLGRIAREADTIVRGEVIRSGYEAYEISQSPVGDLGGDYSIELVYTLHEIHVSERLKVPEGTTPENITVLTLGCDSCGRGRSIHAEGEATLSPGEDVILFLSRDHVIRESRTGIPYGPSVSSGRCRPARRLPGSHPFFSSFSVLGGFQGKYTVYRNRDTDYVWRTADTDNRQDQTLRKFLETVRNEFDSGTKTGG